MREAGDPLLGISQHTKFENCVSEVWQADRFCGRVIGHKKDVKLGSMIDSL